ncbi:transmembrane protein 272-like [Tribolium madens]|uniref:transmembrane protein 272-like n=1 Tax=Tribolium madens TaxID=41895 RepID=UPI001CF73957|nr:transmembrane protein 272-like [Tribolium madens]
MDEQHQGDDGKNKKAVVKNSIKTLKEKFVPGLKVTLLISAALNFSMLVIGCLNVHKCPVNKDIPLFLIATGAIGLVAKFVSYIRERLSKHVQVLYIESALYSVETIFFFLGTYWVYKAFQPSYDPLDGKSYCNKTAYLFAFVYVTAFYAIIIATLAGFCCFICCALCLFAIATRTGNPESPPVNAEETQTSALKVDDETAKITLVTETP